MKQATPVASAGTFKYDAVTLLAWTSLSLNLKTPLVTEKQNTSKTRLHKNISALFERKKYMKVKKVAMKKSWRTDKTALGIFPFGLLWGR